MALLACSCSSSRHVVEEKPEIHELTLVAPYSRMHAAYPDTGLFYADSLSAFSEAIHAAALREAGLPFVREITVVGRPNQEELDASYEWIRDVRGSRLGKTRIPSPMQAFLSVNATRYSMLLYSEGFIWAQDPPIYEEGLQRFDSRLYLCVVDSYTGKIVFFRKSEPEEADPISVKSVRRRISGILKDYNEWQQR